MSMGVGIWVIPRPALASTKKIPPSWVWQLGVVPGVGNANVEGSVEAHLTWSLWSQVTCTDPPGASAGSWWTDTKMLSCLYPHREAENTISVDRPVVSCCYSVLEVSKDR